MQKIILYTLVILFGFVTKSIAQEDRKAAIDSFMYDKVIECIKLLSFQRLQLISAGEQPTKIYTTIL